MALLEVVAGVWRAARLRPPKRWPTGTVEVEAARRLADAERAAGEAPDGCAWLDERTVGDVDLPLVFRAIDRTVSPTGAQVLWRMLAAPAQRLDVLHDRERRLARLADPGRRACVQAALGGQPARDALHLPRLLWEPPPAPLEARRFQAMLALVVGLAALALVWPPLIAAAIVAVMINVWIDDWTSTRHAPQSHALGVLARALDAAERIARGAWPDAEIAADLAALAPLRGRIRWLTAADPMGLVDFVRAGFLVRLLLLDRALAAIERDRARLRRIVRWLGELDALAGIAALRAERPDARVPALAATSRAIAARDLVHPAIAGAIGNDVALTAGLLITGSNMSGKSTFLRTVAVNAICAQAIHTTFGAWRASLFRVFAVMRIADATELGMSTYAVEVAALGQLVAEAGRAAPALFVIDEPFSGTNPALRVPIAVAVLDHLGARDLPIAATHDLDVAAQVAPTFTRGYFTEPEDGQFDRKLRPGVAPTTNALALLVRAGYPDEILAAIDRRIRAA
jgi:hypothetical protein